MDNTAGQGLFGFVSGGRCSLLGRNLLLQGGKDHGIIADFNLDSTVSRDHRAVPNGGNFIICRGRNTGDGVFIVIARDHRPFEVSAFVDKFDCDSGQNGDSIRSVNRAGDNRLCSGKGKRGQDQREKQNDTTVLHKPHLLTAPCSVILRHKGNRVGQGGDGTLTRGVKQVTPA